MSPLQIWLKIKTLFYLPIKIKAFCPIRWINTLLVCFAWGIFCPRKPLWSWTNLETFVHKKWTLPIFLSFLISNFLRVWLVRLEVWFSNTTFWNFILLQAKRSKHRGENSFCTKCTMWPIYFFGSKIKIISYKQEGNRELIFL